MALKNCSNCHGTGRVDSTEWRGGTYVQVLSPCVSCGGLGNYFVPDPKPRPGKKAPSGQLATVRGGKARSIQGNAGKNKAKSDPAMAWLVIGVIATFLWAGGTGASFGVALVLSLIGGAVMAFFYKWVLGLALGALVLYLMSLG